MSPISPRNKVRRTFQIAHGNLTISVPFALFKGNTAVFDSKEVVRFRSLLSSRYPWLSTYALDIIQENARKERQRIIWESRTISQKARILIEQGRLEGALMMIDRHLENSPDDAEAMYVKGETLCRLGRKDEGYRCLARARNLSQ